MARIIYSMAGEGRGHATRAKTVIDQLTRRQHEVVILAPEFAYKLLSELYRNNERVTVEEIPGLLFHYSKCRLDFSRTALAAIDYVRGLPLLVARLQQRIERFEPDLAITDFEPALPRAAKLAGVPWMSVDHQHFLVVSDFDPLPKSLQWKAWGMAQIVGQYYRNPAKMVVSSFYFPEVKPRYQNVVQTGVLLREQVVNSHPEKGDHLVAYIRRFATPPMMEALQKCGHEVRIYGLGEKPSDGNLRFRPISEDGFLDDLRTCNALISNAGNQLLGEALYLDKPILVFPEAKNFEQEINARFLKLGGGGDWCFVDEFDSTRLEKFLGSLDGFQCQTPKSQLNGNPATMQAIESMLPAGTHINSISQQRRPVRVH